MHFTGSQVLLATILAVAWGYPDAVEVPAEVRHLTGNADYRYVSLNWEYEGDSPHFAGFLIRYCELQAWGPNRCRTMNVDNSSLDNSISKVRKSKVYSAKVSGLKMATNYSFEVRPVLSRRTEREYHAVKPGQMLTLSTKGFSAKASLCLPHESEIEVATGPYFAGRVAVEAADGERCTIDGDPNSPRDVYTLRIRHDLCGSSVNETTVSTFVLVQENLPILTHSTRRFLVVCTYQPDTLTVRARLNLPAGKIEEDFQRERLDVDEMQVREDNEVSLEGSSGNDIKVMRLQQTRKNDIDLNSSEIIHGGPIAQFVLMMILIVVGLGGFIFVILWSIRRSRPEEPEMEDCSSACDESLREPSEINFEIESVCGVKDNVSLSSK